MTEPLPDTADVVVVGGGVMGASIAFHLASRGAGDVLLLERDVVCSGPTRHSTAIVRLHYTQPLLVRMAAHGLRVYRAFAEIIGSSAGFTRSGMLFGVDAHDREMLAGNVAVGHAEGVETHLVDHDQVAEIDGRVIAEDLVWCYEPGAGHCDPYRVTAGFAFAAGRSGARMAEGVRVTAVRDGGVSTDAGDVDAGTVVVAAGPWSAPLLAPLGYDLPVTPARATATPCSADAEGRITAPGRTDSRTDVPSTDVEDAADAHEGGSSRAPARRAARAPGGGRPVLRARAQPSRPPGRAPRGARGAGRTASRRLDAARGTKVGDDAVLAARPAGVADAAAMPDEQVREAGPVRPGHEPNEVALDFLRLLLARRHRDAGGDGGRHIGRFRRFAAGRWRIRRRAQA